jgi:hypothetical protein
MGRIAHRLMGMSKTQGKVVTWQAFRRAKLFCSDQSCSDLAVARMPDVNGSRLFVRMCFRHLDLVVDAARKAGVDASGLGIEFLEILETP